MCIIVRTGRANTRISMAIAIYTLSRINVRTHFDFLLLDEITRRLVLNSDSPNVFRRRNEGTLVARRNFAEEKYISMYSDARGTQPASLEPCEYLRIRRSSFYLCTRVYVRVLELRKI